MIRPQTFSETTWPGLDVMNPSVGTPLLSSLSNQTGNRAIDNDYSENPATFRPSSAPICSSILSSESAHGQHGDSTGHHSRCRRDLVYSQRHQMSLPVPGTASRVYPTSTSPEISSPSCVSYDVSDTKPLPPLPSRVRPVSGNHCAPRRCVSEDLSRPCFLRTTPPLTPPRLHESKFRFTSVTPPPRPPPSGPKVQKEPAFVARSSHPALPGNTTQNNHHGAGTIDASHFENQGVHLPTVVLSQPQLNASTRLKCDSISKKSLVVELKQDESTKTRSSQKSDTVRSNKRDASLKKDSDNEISSRLLDDDHEIMEICTENNAKPGEHKYTCPRCGKCMCRRCKGEISGTNGSNRRTVPRCWVCDNRCLCNAQTCVETVTCVCCLRACFYHCCYHGDDDSWVDKPCSCQSSNWCCRWSAIGALTLVLPCLLCYPLARGCMKMCSSCTACIRPGCRCKESNR